MNDANCLDSQYEQALKSWTREQLINASIIGNDSLDFGWSALSGDAGFRRYFRLKLNSSSLLAVYSPPVTEKNQAFLQIGEFLYSHGLHVPKILSHDLYRGFFLIEDMGESLYLDFLNDDSVNILYGEALFALLRIQQSPLDHSIFPEYDGRRLRQEMDLFSDWFVENLLNYSLNKNEKILIENTFDLLQESALQQPKVIVHRDFHSRNIVYGVGGSPGIIDYQDAVIGPVTYDLVSLLRDCYVEWPQSQVRNWALAYGNMAVDAGVIAQVPEQKFLTWFDLMGLQRHIKVLGIFARLSIRDNKHGYLKDLPLVIKYTRRVAPQYASLKAFSQWFDETLLPRVSQQPWMPKSE